MQYTIYDLTGNIGVALIVITYLLLQLNKIKSASLNYSLLNGLGAALIILSLYYEFNLSAFVVELFWLLISIAGVIRHYVQKAR